jgi:hypothetical protein
MKKVIFSLLMVFFIICCTNSKKKPFDIQNTKWVSSIADLPCDTLNIQKDIYLNFSCEMYSHYYGTFSQIGDTLVLIEIGEYNNSEKNYYPNKYLRKLIYIHDNNTLSLMQVFSLKKNRWELEYDNLVHLYNKVNE